ncbi:hypothetical protein BN934_02847 [Lacticaseibacillus rhamnosus]|uniref:hypothetical protein n=1 Tax=Lacticaseibacillus rhamnosus TaxID=47715 RepID=UPI0005DACEDC|nr:hypothetical protein [Lacticaseibacillus rhamnosus]CDN24590.1 hypothetical protein BN934_02847 [Lacticaseibacillus rhamnosus]
MDRPIINAIYFTEKDKSKPMMALPLDSTKLHIDIHVQVINFTLDKHTLTLSVSDQNGNVMLEASQQPMDASSLKARGTYGIVDATLFVVFDKLELKGVNRLRFDISFDNDAKATAYLFVSRGDKND